MTSKLTTLILLVTFAFGCAPVNFSHNASSASASGVPTGGPTGGPTGVPIGPGGGGTITPPACTAQTSNTPVLTTLPPGITQAMVSAACPAVEADTECGAVLIITDSGVSIYYSGQGPYDGNDDTLVGVINMSSVPIGDVVLNSNADIMGFDGDGLDSYGIPGNSQDITNSTAFCSSQKSASGCGYGGPNAYYTNMPSGCPQNDQNKQCTSGTVNFITPIAPNGGTSYFGLENALGTASVCISSLTN